MADDVTLLTDEDKTTVQKVRKEGVYRLIESSRTYIYPHHRITVEGALALERVYDAEFDKNQDTIFFLDSYLKVPTGWTGVLAESDDSPPSCLFIGEVGEVAVTDLLK